MNIGNYIQLEPHTLRRWFATYNAINGMPLPILQELLGHSNITTAAIYVQEAELANLAEHKPI